MYVKYSWKASAARANVLNDIVKLICGAGDTTGLSSDCDAANTIWNANTLASNWTVFDPIALADAQVVRSLNADGVTYKYLLIQLATNGTLAVTGYESWNAATHAGTNPTCGYNRAPLSYNAGLTLTTNGSLNIITGPRYVFVSTNYALGQIPCGLMEFARETPSVGPAYPCHVMWNPLNNTAGCPTSTPFNGSNTSSVWGVSRIVDPVNNNTDLTGIGINYTFVNALGIANNSGGGGLQQNIGSRASDNSRFLIALPIILQGGVNGGINQLVHLGKIQGGVKYMPPAIPAFIIGDEVSIGGTNYVMFPAFTAFGNGAILIPKA